MIKNAFQPVIRQIYCIDRMCCLQKCLRVVSILHDRLPKLLVITCQTVFFVRLVLISVLESLKSQDKMMQPSILCPVEIQNRHSATVHIFAVLILIGKLKFPGIFCQMLTQVFDLKLKAEIFPVLLCRKFLYDLLNGAGVTSVICKEKL